MEEKDFEQELKNHPCPCCGKVGYLHFQRAQIVATYKNKQIVAEGEGTACSACNSLHMGAELAEDVINQVNRVMHGMTGQYLEVNRESGEIVPHSLN